MNDLLLKFQGVSSRRFVEIHNEQETLTKWAYLKYYCGYYGKYTKLHTHATICVGDILEMKYLIWFRKSRTLFSCIKIRLHQNAEMEKYKKCKRHSHLAKNCITLIKIFFRLGQGCTSHIFPSSGKVFSQISCTFRIVYCTDVVPIKISYTENCRDTSREMSFGIFLCCFYGFQSALHKYSGCIGTSLWC